jgi:voltage-gated potassium channel
MVIAALLVIPAIALEESSLGEPWITIGSVLNWVTWLAFLSEAVVMLAVVPRKAEWVRQHPLDVAIVVLTPPVVPAGLQFLRVFRLLRPLRLLRALSARRLLSLEGVRDAAVLTAIVVLASGAVFAETEKGQGVTIWDGVWWAVNTVTTVGAAGIGPDTTAGRITAIGLMFVGIGFVALVTAFAAERFLRQGAKETISEHERQVLTELRRINERLDRLERG